MTIETRIADVVALLSRVARDHAPAALASSFGAEDMVLIDLVAR
jgi:phosphoadenosine phosphosulfate reductase